MIPGALDYAKLAALYDEYCTFAGDIAFFRHLAASTDGEILELMAGTGRVTVPLQADGARLTCVDASIAMLAVLDHKLAGERGRCRLACADVRQLPLAGVYPLVLLPFHGFCELATEADQLGMFRSVAACLAPQGRFVCTSHNPAVRLQGVADDWREMAVVARRDDGVLRVSLRGRYDSARRLVEGEQRIRIEDGRGDIEEVVVELRFSLVSLERMTALAERAGLRRVAVYGDYERAAYEPEISPAIIAVFAPLS